MFRYFRLIFILALCISCSEPQNKEIIGGKIVDKREILHWDAVIQQHIYKNNVKISINGAPGRWVSNDYLYKNKNIGDSIWFDEYQFPNYIKIVERRD